MKKKLGHKVNKRSLKKASCKLYLMQRLSNATLLKGVPTRAPDLTFLQLSRTDNVI